MNLQFVMIKKTSKVDYNCSCLAVISSVFKEAVDYP